MLAGWGQWSSESGPLSSVCGASETSGGPPVTAGLPGADQTVAREPPAQPAGGAEAEGGEEDPWLLPAPRTLVWGGRRRQRV